MSHHLSGPNLRSPRVAPVQRRIARLEELGVIEGYTVRVNQNRIASGLEAITELRFAGNMELHQIMEFVAQIPEVDEVLTLAGDPDALVRIRVSSVQHLQRVVSRLRSAPVSSAPRPRWCWRPGPGRPDPAGDVSRRLRRRRPGRPPATP